MPKMMMYASAYAPLAPGSLVITENIYTGLNIADMLGNPGGPIDVYITIAAGVFVRSNSAERAAISTKGLPEGSTVTLNNLGYIIGAGGKGGAPNEYFEPGPWSPEGGQHGGDAIYSTVPISIASAFGYIWGGGGGSPGTWSGKTTFYPGAGGAGHTDEYGGGESGEPLNYTYSDSQRKNATAKNFVSLANWGSPGTGVNSGNQGGSYGELGDAAAGAGGLQVFPNSFTTMPGPRNAGSGGWAVNLAQGTSATLTWLDTAPSLTATRKRVVGLVGNRPETHMDWRAHLKPWVMLSLLGDVQDFNLAAYLGYPTEPQKVFLYIAPGVHVTASDARIPAFSTKDMPVGSTLYLKSRGRIIGRGGRGGQDAQFNDDPSIINPERGQDGGDGLYLTIPTTIALHDYLTSSRFGDEQAMIAGGGAGGGRIRIYPYAEQSFGGQGGMGGGTGGRGTIANGSDSPFFEPTELSRSRNSENRNYPDTYAEFATVTLSVLRAVDYDAYTEDTIFKNTQGRAGTYGYPGIASKSLAYSTSDVEETQPSGFGGWALNSISNVVFLAQSGAMTANSNGSSIAQPYMHGNLTHTTRGTLIVNPPVRVKPVRLTPEVRVEPQAIFLVPGGTQNFNLHEAMGSPAGPVNALIWIPENAVISSVSASKPALTTGLNINRASNISIYNAGIIIGCGGDGGGYDATYGGGPVDYLSPMLDGKPGGNAVEYARFVGPAGSAIRYTLVNTVFNGTKSRSIKSTAQAGGGGGIAYLYADYYGAEGNWQYVPESLQIGYGGGGGAGGGKGGVGTRANGSDGGQNAYYTTDSRWGDNRGYGPVLTQLISGSAVTKDVQLGMGGYFGATAVGGVIASGSTYKQQKQNANGTWTASKLYGIFACGKPGSPGTAVMPYA